MNINPVTFLFFLLLLAGKAFAQVKQVVKISSPDKATMLEVKIDEVKEVQYRIFQGREEVLTWSPLGLNANGAQPGSEVKIVKQAKQRHNENIPWSTGESDFIKNNYNEVNLFCQTGPFKFNILARIFNGSVAFQYQVPVQAELDTLRIQSEKTAYNLTGLYTIYQYHGESVFTPGNIDTLGTKTSDFPSTLTNGKTFIIIGEAGNFNYTKAEIKKGQKPHSLSVAFTRDKEVVSALPFLSPWRTISFSKTAIGLHEFATLNMKLSPPASGKVPGPILPGKLIRAGLTTQAGMDCIGFAKKLDFRYIMFDAGWYGRETLASSDPSVVIPEIDMPKVIAYGKQNGIGVILYVNYIALRNHLDTIVPLFKRWGVRGIKFGFVDAHTQRGISWVSSAIKKVNDAGLIINIHDNFKPTGLSRTYPALLTQEGIRGDENGPDAFHTTVLPFTRFIAGAADFTFCYPNEKNKYTKNLKVSKAQQLALTVVYFSPLQAIFWYGQPGDYTNFEEIEFFKYVPTTWNETKYLKGNIGENISVARRNGADWYIGCATGFNDWKNSLTLDFLKKEHVYSATIYEDSGVEGIAKRVIEVRKNDVVPLDIRARGGLAMVIRPVSQKVLNNPQF